MPGAQLRDLPCRPRTTRPPGDRGDQLVMVSWSPPHPPGSSNPPHDAAALQHPGLRDHPAHRVADPVRAIRARQPPPPVHQRHGSKPDDPATRTPPSTAVTPPPPPPRRRIVMQHLQHQHHAITLATDASLPHNSPQSSSPHPTAARRQNANMLPAGTRCPTSAPASSNCRSTRSLPCITPSSQDINTLRPATPAYSGLPSGPPRRRGAAPAPSRQHDCGIPGGSGAGSGQDVVSRRHGRRRRG